MSFPRIHHHGPKMVYEKTSLEPIPEEGKKITHEKFKALYHPIPARYSQVKLLVDKWLNGPKIQDKSQ